MSLFAATSILFLLVAPTSMPLVVSDTPPGMTREKISSEVSNRAIWEERPQSEPAKNAYLEDSSPRPLPPPSSSRITKHGDGPHAIDGSHSVAHALHHQWWFFHNNQKDPPVSFTQSGCTFNEMRLPLCFNLVPSWNRNQWNLCQLFCRVHWPRLAGLRYLRRGRGWVKAGSGESSCWLKTRALTFSLSPSLLAKLQSQLETMWRKRRWDLI